MYTYKVRSGGRRAGRALALVFLAGPQWPIGLPGEGVMGRVGGDSKGAGGCCRSLHKWHCRVSENAASYGVNLRRDEARFQFRIRCALS